MRRRGPHAMTELTLLLRAQACSPSAHSVDHTAGSASLSLAHCPAYVFFHRGVAPATLSVGREWSADVDSEGLQAHAFAPAPEIRG